MNYKSVFDIMGPTMIGPSSSHTAGAVRIGMVGKKILGGIPSDIKIYLYGSFAETYKGHGTDLALIGGLLGFDTDNKEIPDSINIATKLNISIKFIPSNDLPPHPNTAKLIISNSLNNACVTGISIGGGNMQTININGVNTILPKNIDSFLISHSHNYLEEIKNILDNNDVIFKKVSYDNSPVMLTLVESSQDIKTELMNKIKAVQNNNNNIVDIFEINS